MNEDRYIKNWVYWAIGVVMIVSAITWVCTRTANVVDTGLVRYQDFQELYDACESINTQICQIKDVDENDKMFEMFSKNQRITGLQAQLSRRIAEYNAKSKVVTHSVWKSNTLPYQLSVNQFSCY